MPRFLQKIVAGTLQVTGGSPGSGKVLTSDASGNATWATPSSGAKYAQTFFRTGTLSISAEPGTTRWYNDSGGTLTISNIRASVGTAPTGSSILIDVNVDGTTIWSTQANRLAIAASGTTATTTTFNTTSVANGSYLTVDVDQSGATTRGADLVVTIWLTS